MAPTPTTLHDAALRHLGRYAATVAGLTRVLDRRIDRWARSTQPETAAVAAAREAAREVAARLAAAGAVDDAAFAEGRTRTLTRAGRSRRAIAAHLAARGADPQVARTVTEAEELAAAVRLARRRHLGPFAVVPPDAERLWRELAALARAGFAESVARQALTLSREEAEALLTAAKA